MRLHCLHHQVMSSLPPRHLRRHTLIATDRDGLSEGALIRKADRTVVEVVGGTPFATLELFAAHHRVASITLDELGSGSATLPGIDEPPDGTSMAVTVCQGGDAVLEGLLISGRGPDPAAAAGLS